MAAPMLPDDSDKAEFMKMHWSAKLQNRQKWQYARDMGAPKQEYRVDRCMDCGLKMDPAGTTREKRNFYFFASGAVFCQGCVHRYAMANIKKAKWRDFKGEHRKVLVSWLELSTFNSLTFMDENDVPTTIRLDPHIDIKILIYVFYWDESVKGWTDFEHNERMPERYEKKMWKWIEAEGKEMAALNRDTVRGKGLNAALEHQRYMRKMNPLHSGGEMDARKVATNVVPKKVAP